MFTVIFLPCLAWMVEETHACDGRLHRRYPPRPQRNTVGLVPVVGTMAERHRRQILKTVIRPYPFVPVASCAVFHILTNPSVFVPQKTAGIRHLRGRGLGALALGMRISNSGADLAQVRWYLSAQACRPGERPIVERGSNRRGGTKDHPLRPVHKPSRARSHVGRLQLVCYLPTSTGTFFRQVRTLLRLCGTPLSTRKGAIVRGLQE